MKMMVENFLQTQKNMISDIEKKYVSDENKEKLAEKKKQFTEYSQKYLKQWEKLLQEIKNNEKLEQGKQQASNTAWSILWFLKKSFSQVADVSEKTSDSLAKAEKKVEKK